MDDFEKKTPEAFEDTSEKANAAQNCADGFKEERSAAEHSAADAYLSVTYGDSTKEEIVLPLVFWQEKWRLKWKNSRMPR